jgi:hypothetical protein
LNQSIFFNPANWPRCGSGPGAMVICSVGNGSTRQRQWLDALLVHADHHDPGYGQLGYYRQPGATMLEDSLNPWTHPHVAIAASRKLLRGYAWLTIVPRDLVSTLDSEAGLARS